MKDKAMSQENSSVQRTRRQPVQQRSKQTLARILDAASEILSETGMPGLNTNAVAERAGINIATLYSYLPDKQAIIHTLAARFDDKRTQYVEMRSEDLTASTAWQVWFGEIIDKMVEFRIAEPGGIALRRALLSSPELHELDRESSARSARAIAAALRVRNPRLSSDRARAIAEVITDSITTVLDSAVTAEGCDTIKVRELKQLIAAYVSLYVDADEAQEGSGPKSPTPRAARRRS